jgi:hypothetical protein
MDKCSISAIAAFLASASNSWSGCLFILVHGVRQGKGAAGFEWVPGSCRGLLLWLCNRWFFEQRVSAWHSSETCENSFLSLLQGTTSGPSPDGLQSQWPDFLAYVPISAHVCSSVGHLFQQVVWMGGVLVWLSFLMIVGLQACTIHHSWLCSLLSYLLFSFNCQLDNLKSMISSLSLLPKAATLARWLALWPLHS